MEESNDNNLTPKERYDLKKAEKDHAKEKDITKEKVRAVPKKVGKYILYTSIVVGIIVGIGWSISLIPNLPPTSSKNHSEDSPSSHIVTKKISDPIQRHMLEHADGDGFPSVIIQYNCDDYECEPDLIQKLTKLVKEYTENVYLAPNNYDGKIILTRAGQYKILDQFDEQTIRDFIKLSLFKTAN